MRAVQIDMAAAATVSPSTAGPRPVGEAVPRVAAAALPLVVDLVGGQGGSAAAGAEALVVLVFLHQGFAADVGPVAGVEPGGDLGAVAVVPIVVVIVVAATAAAAAAATATATSTAATTAASLPPPLLPP